MRDAKFPALGGVKVLSETEQRELRGGKAYNRAECIRDLLNDYATARRNGKDRGGLLTDLWNGINNCSPDK